MKEVYKDLKIENTQGDDRLNGPLRKRDGTGAVLPVPPEKYGRQLENVGYAAPGKACIYNVLIMEEQQTIIGCGAGTTTKRLFAEENRIERCENVKDVEQYISRVDEMIERKEKLLSD